MTMRFLTTLAGILVSLSPAIAADQQAKEPTYDMDHYVVGFLKRGPKWTPQSTPETQRIQDGHMANIRRMAAIGKLVVAGPFEDNGDLRGMFIFKCSLEEAKREAEQDPAVQAGRLILELHPWFAAKGIKPDPPK